MIKKVLWGVGIIVIALSSYVAYVMLTTRSHSPAETVSINSGGTNISIEYCRPYKKGRQIFGGLVPYGAYWRTGANEPTIIKFSKSVSIDGQEIPAGSYRFYTVPNENEWTIALNSELERWGYYEPDYDLDIFRTKVPVSKLPGDQEQFEITLSEATDGVDLTMKWEQTSVTVPIKI